MSKLRLRISLSLDGFVAGPNQSVQEPLGVGGESLHDWVFPLEIWRSKHGQKGGEVNASTAVMEAELANLAGLVDEMQLHIAPLLLGSGERLFDGVTDLHGLRLVETVGAPNVAHLRFARA